jgi:hypothetical protein
MKKFSRKGSSAYLVDMDKDENDDEKFYENLNQNTSSKKKYTDIICNGINYISLILTAVYNIFWIFVFHQILPKLEDYSYKNCPEIFNWNNYYYTWVIISLSKAFIFLLCAKVSTGSEFDCNFFCLILKILSSLIPCILFVIKVPYYGPNTYDKENDGACNALYDNLSRFYRYENYYLIFIVCLCFTPILGGIAMSIKEYIKCLAEKSDNENNINTNN